AIPPLRKKEIIRLQAEHGLGWMLATEPGRLRRIYQSPGPIYDPEGRGSNYWGWAEAFYAAGFRPEDLVQMTFSYHLTPAGLMLEEPLREIGCCVIPAGPGNTAVQLEIMSTLPVTGFVGMASYLRTIGLKAGAQGLDPRADIGLEVAFVAAERLTQALRSEVEEMFGMVVRQGYGTADVGCIAYECRELGGMHLSTRCLVEICDPVTGVPVEDGQTGEVVVTPFTEDYPLIRLATGDLSFLVSEPCPCGRSSVRLGGIVGRVDDTVKVKGQFLYAAQAESVMQEFPQIRSWQIVVTNPGGRETLTLKLEFEGELNEPALLKLFQERLKLRPVVERTDKGSIPAKEPRIVDRREFDQD
ncbi:MAG: phenylacetate--CoA ligase family protein, partial [Desulfohalobiaceae bacterium]